MRGLAQSLAWPLIVGAIVASLYATWLVIDLPPEETLVRIAQDLFERYGVGIVLAAAILEGLFLVGWYLPGTLVIMLAFILAGQDAPRVAFIAALAITGLYFAYLINFFVGKHGWYRLLVVFGMRRALEQGQQRLTKYGLNAIFLTFWQLNLASVTSTAAGILQFPFARFSGYALAATTLWMIFWSSLIFLLGPAAMELVGLRFILALIVVWIAFRTGAYLYASVKR